MKAIGYVRVSTEKQADFGVSLEAQTERVKALAVVQGSSLGKRGIMSPRQVVERWVEQFNAADADGLADLYHDDAVNHQVTQDPVEGRDAIRAMFEREFATADMTCIVEAIHDAGDVVALEWRDPLGLRGCGFFTVRDGRIAFQRGYWDKLSFLKMHGLPVE